MADEIAPILAAPAETSLIVKPYLDRLANAQYQKNLKKKELEESKKRARIEERLKRDKMQSQWQVELFLKTHFPDVFDPGEVASLPQNEFKELLKRSRNWLWKKAISYYSGYPISIGFLAGFVGVASNYPPHGLAALSGVLLLLGGLLGLAVSSISVVGITKVLLNKASYKTFKALEPATKNAS